MREDPLLFLAGFSFLFKDKIIIVFVVIVVCVHLCTGTHTMAPVRRSEVNLQWCPSTKGSGDLT